MLSNLFMVALHFIVGLLKWVLIIGSAVALPFVISGLIHLIYVSCGRSKVSDVRGV